MFRLRVCFEGKTDNNYSQAGYKLLEKKDQEQSEVYGNSVFGLNNVIPIYPENTHRQYLQLEDLP